MLKNHAASKLVNFLFASIILVYTSSCFDKESQNNPIPSSKAISVTLPLKIQESTVFVSNGRAQNVSTESMDLFAILIESTVAGENSYSTYANGLFSNVPDSISFHFLSGYDYIIRAFLYNNSVDSVYEGTIASYLNDPGLINELWYDEDVIPFFDKFTIYAEGAVYYRTLSDSSFVSRITQFPMIDHYFTEIQYSPDADTLEELEFLQENTRFEINVNNSTVNSKITLKVENFESLPITSDTTFNLDIKRHFSSAHTGNRVKVSVTHNFSTEENNISQLLYEDNIILDRLEIIRFEINTPNIDSTSNALNSGFVIIEEQFIRGDTIKIGG
ncbi:hypothetical protein [Marinoscillum pacificum]|uniref:hypothetical protein n=1 Tax=Marinoscillum pacificum TaxID=392723 RepID=UPI00215792BC|nr:hypothetical protein [Marinoscillum pacificum]